MSLADKLLAIAIGCGALLALYCLAMPFVGRMYRRPLWTDSMPPEMTYFPNKHYL